MNIVGACDHYAAFVDLCRRRIEELGITAATVDKVAGLPERYTSTLLSGGKTMSVHSLFAVAGALGLQPLFAHDAARLAQLEQRSDWIKMSRTGPRYRSGRNSDSTAEIEDRAVS